MTALFWTVLVASLVGSLHCAGMCGAFVAFAIGAGEPGVKTSRGRLLALYQAGRLVTYAALGTAAGAVGAGIDLSGRLVGLQQTAAVLAGMMMVGFGAWTLLRLGGVRWGGLKMPSVLTTAVSAGHRRAMRYSPPVRAVATGLLTTLLPCGWLWAFVITAGGTGHAWSGGAVMAVFWVGTLPMLTIVGVGVRKLAVLGGGVAAKSPAITASAIVLVGVYTIVARAGVVLHGGHGRAMTAEELRAEIKGIEQEKLPCCTTRAAADAKAEAGEAK